MSSVVEKLPLIARIQRLSETYDEVSPEVWMFGASALLIECRVRIAELEAKVGALETENAQHVNAIAALEAEKEKLKHALCEYSPTDEPPFCFGGKHECLCIR